MPPRIVRMTECSPELLLDMQQQLASLLKEYIALGHLHVELMQKYHALLDRHLSKTTLVP